jgi:Ca-activated chloride channel family protein
MSFLHPEFLYYMLPPLFILFGLLLTQKEAQATFFAPDVIDRLRVSANTLTLKARNALFLLIGILLVIALAGPVIKEGKIAIKAKSADIMIALDISDSMLASDVYPNRLKFAKQKALQFLHLAPQDRIGVIAFAKNSYLVSPLSFDHEAVAFLLKNLDTNSITEQGTDLMSMLEVVDRSIKNKTRRYVLLLSDGGDSRDFSREIAYAKEHNITIFVLAVGTKKGAPIKMSNGEFVKENGKIILTKRNDAIADLATQSGGVYIEALNSDEDVKAMLREIEAKAKKKVLKSEEIERYIPLFYYPVGFALLLLLIATSSMSKREHVEVPSMFFVGFLLLFSSQNLKAGLLNFVDLEDAKKAYSAKEYEKSAHYYERYAKESGKGEAYYNAGNAYYKLKQYQKAIKNYKKATFDNKESRAKNFANMGNTYAKVGTQKALREAISEYEASLKIKEDSDVRENLEAVKRALKKKEKKQQNKKNKKQKQNKKKQSQQNNKNQKEQSQNKNSQQNKSANKQKEDKKENKNKQKNNSQQQEQKSKQQEQQKKDKSKNKENNKKQHKDSLKELKSKESQSKKEKQRAAAKKSQQKKKEIKMSDAEEKKWLKTLNLEQNSYLYRLNRQKPIKEDENVKPW